MLKSLYKCNTSYHCFCCCCCCKFKGKCWLDHHHPHPFCSGDPSLKEVIKVKEIILIKEVIIVTDSDSDSEMKKVKKLETVKQVKKLQNWTIDALAILVLTCACLLTCAVCTIYLTVWNCEIFEKIKLYKISHTLKFEIFEKLYHTLKLWDIWKLFILYKIFHAEP